MCLLTPVFNMATQNVNYCSVTHDERDSHHNLDCDEDDDGDIKRGIPAEASFSLASTLE